MMLGVRLRLLGSWREMRLKLQSWEISAKASTAEAQGAQ
jgi:hypothetical protein